MLFGLFSGLISSFFVERARQGKSNARFLKVWGWALAFRFVFLLVAVLAVYRAQARHPLAILLALVLTQTLAQFLKPGKTWALKR